MAIGGNGLPWHDPQHFAELMLSWEMRSHHMARDRVGPVFFDRGVPDVAGYLTLLGLPIPDHVHRATELFRYNKRAFVAPPWPEIFRRDRERKQTFAEAVCTYEALVKTYTACRYELVEIPHGPIEERARFVIEQAKAASN